MATFAAITVSAGAALAQSERSPPPPKDPGPSAAPTNPDQRIGDPYPLDICPVTGKKLGAMGDPLVKLYSGREVKFCCPGCPEKFEKDQAANMAKLDQKIIAAQGPSYPLKTSVVTGKELPAKPYEFVYGNRLVRLGTEGEKAEFLKDPAKNIAALKKASIELQSKDGNKERKSGGE